MRRVKAVSLFIATTCTALAAAGCAGTSASDDPSSPSNGSSCLVVGTAGLNDHGFNASAWKGLKLAQKETGIKATYLETQDDSQYATNIASFVRRNCSLIVTVGFPAQDATVDAAKQNPDQKFAIVDVSIDPPLDNLRGVSFDTAQAAFVAGYAAAGVSKTKKVATFGAMKIPAIELFMDGFTRGVQYFDQQNGESVKVLGWSTTKKDGVFTGSFTDQEKAKQTAAGLIQQGADVIFPPVAAGKSGAYAAIAAAGNGVMAINGDVDGCEAFPKYCSIMLTSVQKQVSAGLVKTLEDVSAGKFKGGTFVGNLANKGVSLGSFNKNANQISDALAKELDALQADIVSGKVTVGSPYSPKE